MKSISLHRRLLPGFLLIAGSASADTEEFASCVQRLSTQASQAGVSAAVIDRAVRTLQYEQRVIDLDQRQPEFTDTVANYLARRITPQRIEQGRKLMQSHRTTLQRATDRYGVQQQYLLAFWGLESNFGGNFGNIPVVNSLGTLACDQRRSAFFTAEFIDALRILDRGHVEPNAMVGSWAGAMGHTQFMPSTYLRHAVDGDGDGRIDLWRSVPDAMTSAANFLNSLGWQAGVRWGREVALPKGFDYSQAGLDRPRALSEWRTLGVKDAHGSALPRADMQAALIVPTGHRGPAFLVYDNFRVIMRWNRSELYALSVGLLADAIAGAPGLVKSPPGDIPRMRREQVIAMQAALAERGFELGEPDGVLGPATRKAIQAFQKDEGLVPDGQVDTDVLTKLGIECC